MIVLSLSASVKNTLLHIPFTHGLPERTVRRLAVVRFGDTKDKQIGSILIIHSKVRGSNEPNKNAVSERVKAIVPKDMNLKEFSSWHHQNRVMNIDRKDKRSYYF
ncbi:hypothetical protein HNY73_015539 [Argiope bruennichi]|uniref:Uncharacterized protein n=1 Tax=Argiope bruennichi TaxID=94029 RepID=A0A8T0EUC2_ARGBR|nr:hypothetical protein HNY73_015539 [Argiope bruennichi]